jgi:hypothetical protein
MRAENLPWEGVKYHGGIGSLMSMTQAFLTEIGHDIGLIIHQRQRGEPTRRKNRGLTAGY